jgi:hypothetical protein
MTRIKQKATAYRSFEVYQIELFYGKGNFPQGKIQTVVRANTDLSEINELNSKKV